MSRTTAQGGSDGARGGGNPVGAVGVQGFVSVTNFVQSAAGVFFAGSITGFGVAIAMRVLSVPAGTTIAYTSGDSSARGGAAYYVAANGFAFAVYTTAGVQIISPYSVIGAGDVEKVLLFCLLHDSANLRTYRAGAEVGAGTPIVGYKPPAGVDRTALGSGVAGVIGIPWARMLGAVCFTGIPTPADILAHYNACKAANTMESMGGAGVVNVNRWQAKDNIPNAATWVDDIGGMVLTKTGTLQSVIFNPTWE